MNILINNAALAIINNSATLEQAVAWADVHCPNDDFTVVGDDHKHYTGYTDFELRILLEKLTGKEHTATTPRSLTLDALIKGAEELEVDNTVLSEVIAQAKPKTAKPAPIAESKKKISDGSVSEVKRPATGTVTGSIWDAIDHLIDRAPWNGRMPAKVNVIDELVNKRNLDINKSTITTQYSKYKRYLNQEGTL